MPMTLAETTAPTVTERSADGVSWIILNRPDRLNAVTPELYDALAPIVEPVAIAPDVRCVVLTGAGRAFCARRDFKAGWSESPAELAGSRLERRIDYLRRYALLPRKLPFMDTQVTTLRPASSRETWRR